MAVVTDPGYGPGGERLDPTGAIQWQAIAPPVSITEGDDDYYSIVPLGLQTIPYIDQDDDNVWTDIYLGGVVT